MGRGSSDDKFTLAEIDDSKRVTFDGITGAKIGGDYWNKFMNGSNGNMCIPMDTNAPEVPTLEARISVNSGPIRLLLGPLIISARVLEI